MSQKPVSVVYVSNAESKQVFAFRDSWGTGELELFQQIDIPGIDGPSPFSAPMAVSLDKRFLFAVLRKPPFPVSTFAIDPQSGQLSWISAAHLHNSVCYLSIDKTGRFLLSASYFGGNIAVNRVDPDGKVQLEAKQILASGEKTHCIILDHANRYGYSAALDDDYIRQYRFDENAGRFEPNPVDSATVPKNSGPRHLVLSPDGRFLYAITEYGANVVVFSVDAESGALSRRQTIDLLPPGRIAGIAEAADIHLTQDGRFLFGSERVSNTITSFWVDPDSGMLTEIERFETEREPRSFAVHFNGQHLLVAGQASNTLGIYRIDQSGGRAQLIGRQPLGGTPTWVEVVAFG
jgi:6-phosphogluconolactonase